MPTLYKNSFDSGLIPSDDEANGRDNGFLRMDNLYLDDGGAVEITRGTQRINTNAFANAIRYIYSKILNGRKWRYVNDGGTVKRDDGDFSAPVTVLTGGNFSPGTAYFSTGFGQVFVSSGLVRIKDDGTTIRNLGIEPPTNSPTVTAITPQFKFVTGVAGNTSADYSAWTQVEGTGLSAFGTWVQANADSAAKRGIIENIYASTVDTTALSDNFIGDDNDTFSINFQIASTDFVNSVRVAFLLSAPTGGTNRAVDVSDYYYFDFVNQYGSNFVPGVFVWSTLTCFRRDFVRVGTDPSKNWTNVKAIRVIVSCNQSTVTNNFSIANPEFVAGSQGSKGVYRYIQVNVFEGDYSAQSPGGPPSVEIQLTGGGATLTPDISNLDPQVNFIYWFRQGGTLPAYYFVGKQQYPLGIFTDVTTDAEALLTNIQLNRFLASIGQLPDEIFGISSAINGHILYMTYKNIVVSDFFDPDAYDTRKIIQMSSLSGIGETNLFMAVSSSSVVYVGTTSDIYEISGTFADLPDGTMDVTIRPLGVKQPPICETFAIQNNLLFYVADDGPRFLMNSQSILLSTELLWLWKGVDRYGAPGFLILGANQSPHRLAVHKDKLWMIMYDTHCGASVYIYDLSKKYWYRLFTNPATLFNEEDGTLIAGYGDGFLRVMDITYQLDGLENQVITLRTPLTKELPLQRKDIYTLKLNMDTGNTPVKVFLGDESTRPPIELGEVTANGLTEIFFNISNTVHNLKKRFSLMITEAIPDGITGSGVAFFRLVDWAIEYDPRPVQRTHLRIPPTNFGSPARKRIRTLPLILDTLGGDVTFTPTVDLVHTPPSTLMSFDKRTLYHFFGAGEDVFGTDYGGILDAPQEFEFYEFQTPLDVEEIPVPRKFDQIGPIQFDRAGKLLEFRIRVLPLAGCLEINYTVYMQDVNIQSGTITVLPEIDDTYSIKMPKGIIGRVCRIEFSAAEPFCRWLCQLRVNLSGMKSQASWITAKEPIRKDS